LFEGLVDESRANTFIVCVLLLLLLLLLGNDYFEGVEQFKYLEITLTNQSCIHEEIKSRLKSGNDCYHSVQNFLSSSLLYKNVNIKVHRTVIFPVVYGCETESLKLREERRLKIFKSRVLRVEVTGEWRKLYTGMRRITTFRSTMDRIYDGGPIRL
jgi:hypothetical protein